jgi:hypothetical protein
MMIDIYGLETSTDSALARDIFADATASLAAHRPTTAARVVDVLAHDPDHVAALALKGFANLILARAELQSEAVRAAHDARSALHKRGGGTFHERALVDALDVAASGHFAGGADILETCFANGRASLLPFKIAHSLRFMLGGGAAPLLAGTRRMMRNWELTQPGAGYFLGCRAFALEESGHYGEAERTGRMAVALQPDDAWGLHAVSHVHEMRNAVTAGIDWLEKTRHDWVHCNNFSFHIAWHLALLYLEAGRREEVLALYDTEIRPVQTDDFRDVANAVSLLRRLEMLGIDVGPRWQDLADIARRRSADTTLIFAALHTLIALVMLHDRTGVATLLDQMAKKAQGSDEQSRVARDIGLPLARMIAGMTDGSGAEIDDLAAMLSRLGGSNAQRDLFLLELAEMAARHDRPALSRLQARRSHLKAEDRLIAAIEARAVIAPRRSDAQTGRHRVRPSLALRRSRHDRIAIADNGRPSPPYRHERPDT